MSWKSILLINCLWRVWIFYLATHMNRVGTKWFVPLICAFGLTAFRVHFGRPCVCTISLERTFFPGPIQLRLSVYLEKWVNSVMITSDLIFGLFKLKTQCQLVVMIFDKTFMNYVWLQASKKFKKFSVFC